MSIGIKSIIDSLENIAKRQGQLNIEQATKDKDTLLKIAKELFGEFAKTNY